MKIFLVDNNKKFRKNLKLFLEEHLNHQVVGESSDIKDFKLTVDPNIDIILMDIKNTVLREFHSIDYIKNKNEGFNFIALSQYNELADLLTLLNSGFKGFVSKENIFRDLDKAINTVVSGQLFYPKSSTN